MDQNSSAFTGRTGSKPRVLVVDDELPVRRLLERFLSNKNFEVITTGDGMEAVTLANSQKPDVILLDLRMPSMDGLEVLKAIRQKDPTIGIVMLTGASDKKHIKEAAALGASDYLFKPFDLPYILNYLATYLSNRVKRLNP